MIKQWRIADPCPIDFAERIGVENRTVAQLLWNRGIHSKQDVVDFLDPSWERHVHDSGKFQHMRAAVDRIFSALDGDDRVTVHGDYDADGVTGSTVLIQTMREIEKRKGKMNSAVDFYIPHRDKEGYGLHRETVYILKERGTSLIITVDCGISCVDEIALATSEGIDVIVVDHHQFGEVLPRGYLIHPGLPGESYPWKSLAAVGVAFKLACALFEEGRRRGFDIPVGAEKWLLDLVAIATVTDMVPLLGENRVLETYGLRVLNKTRRPGLLALLRSARVEPGTVDATSVGFFLGPRINAAGRMRHASLALELLLAETDEEASTLVAELERCNTERKTATAQMVQGAETQLGLRYPSASYPDILVLWDSNWSPALVGLLAGKFVERFGRPVVAIGHHEGMWIGSGRSLPEYDITAAMRTAGEGVLTRVGGHVQACGFSLGDENGLSVLRDALEAHATSFFSGRDLVPTLDVDGEIRLSDLTMSFAEEVGRLAPFGVGNREPVFVSKSCRVVDVGRMGSEGSHLRFTLLGDGGNRIKAIAFRAGERSEEVGVGDAVDIAYHVTVNEWNGRRSVECRLVDFHKSI